jgi:hypothetical protein
MRALGKDEYFSCTRCRQNIEMVGVAQLVELRIVIPAVGGSNPLVHPISLQELYTAAFYSMNTLGVFLHMLRQG